MKDHYIPLFSSVVRSSLWSCSGDRIKVFLTLCAVADAEGFVVASVDGVRRLADMSLEDTLAHLNALESPDPMSKDISRDSTRDGRRIERVPNGWRILNIEWYRSEARRQAELFRKRKWWNEKGSDARRDARRTETETETETETKIQRGPEQSQLRTGRKRKCAMPADFKPARTPATLKLESGLNVAAEWEAFKDRAERDGATYLNWDAAWRTWLRNAKRWAKPGTVAAPVKAGRPAADVLREFEEQK